MGYFADANSTDVTLQHQNKHFLLSNCFGGRPIQWELSMLGGHPLFQRGGISLQRLLYSSIYRPIYWHCGSFQNEFKRTFSYCFRRIYIIWKHQTTSDAYRSVNIWRPLTRIFNEANDQRAAVDARAGYWNDTWRVSQDEWHVTEWLWSTCQGLFITQYVSRLKITSL
jgi:hypothetical protein